jgi:hypothetical protein
MKTKKEKTNKITEAFKPKINKRTAKDSNVLGQTDSDYDFFGNPVGFEVKTFFTERSLIFSKNETKKFDYDAEDYDAPMVVKDDYVYEDVSLDIGDVCDEAPCNDSSF